jgi:hypothetical protein
MPHFANEAHGRWHERIIGREGKFRFEQAPIAAMMEKERRNNKAPTIRYEHRINVSQPLTDSKRIDQCRVKSTSIHSNRES